MQMTEIRERVKVRADFFPGGKVVPLLVRRKGLDPFRVRRVHSSWEDKEHGGRRLYFSVTTDLSDDTYQLCYREEDRTWWLDSVMMDG
ncbi:MAG: hypothetical protein ACOC8E_07670 [Planctomycetota bacterium]